MRSTNHHQRNNEIYQYERSSDDDSQDCARSDESSDEPDSTVFMSPQSGAPANPLNPGPNSNSSANSNQAAAANLFQLMRNEPVVRRRTDNASTPSIVSDDESQNESEEVNSAELHENSDSSEEISSTSSNASDNFPINTAHKYTQLNVGIKQKNFETLINQIKTDTSVKKLTLDLGGYTSIDETTAKQKLRSLGDAISRNKEIREIEIKNKEYDIALDDLFDLLSKNPCLESILVSDIDSDRIRSLTDKLAGNRTLKKLVLKFVNWPDSALAKSIHTLISNNPALTTLHFSDNASIKSASLASRVDNRPDFSPLVALASASEKLTDLNISLRSYRLTENELVALQQSLQKNKSLKSLKLNFTYNSFISNGMIAATAALDKHPTLECLQLRSADSLGEKKPGDGNEMAIAMARVLTQLPCLHTLTLEFPFDETGAIALGNSLRYANINTLILKFYWKKEVTSILLNSMEAHKNLQTLEVSVGQSHIVPHLIRILNKNQSLSRLVVTFHDSAHESDEDHQSLAAAIEKYFQLTEYVDKFVVFSPENEARVEKALTRNLQLTRAPEAARGLKAMMRIASPTSRPAFLIQDPPTEILEQIIAAMIIHARTRTEAQIVLDTFMLENTVRVEEVEDSSS